MDVELRTATRSHPRDLPRLRRMTGTADPKSPAPGEVVGSSAWSMPRLVVAVSKDEITYRTLQGTYGRFGPYGWGCRQTTSRTAWRRRASRIKHHYAIAAERYFAKHGETFEQTQHRQLLTVLRQMDLLEKLAPDVSLARRLIGQARKRKYGV